MFAFFDSVLLCFFCHLVVFGINALQGGFVKFKIDHTALVEDGTSSTIFDGLGHVVDVDIIAKHFACRVVFEGNRCTCKPDISSVRQGVAHHSSCANLEFACLFVNGLAESVLATVGFISHHDDVSALG